jgi:hypothetical protein
MVCLHISEKQIKKLLKGHFWQKIVQRIVRRFECNIARVDGPEEVM